MALSCRKLAPNHIQKQICDEEVRRFNLSPENIREAGGIMAVAATKADEEYRQSLNGAPLSQWHPPRQTTASFVHFLDSKDFRIPWYFENTTHIAAIQNRVSNAPCAPSCTMRQTMKTLATLWLGTSPDDWGLRIAATSLQNHREQNPDEVVATHEFRCSEWTNLQIASALLVEGSNVIAQFDNQGDMPHIEPYWLDVKTNHVAIVWDSGAFSDMSKGGAIRQTAIPRPDIAVITSANKILTSGSSKHQITTDLRKLLIFTTAPQIKTWLMSVIRDLSIKN